MGVDPSEYEAGGYGGYGVVKIATEEWFGGFGKYGDGELDQMTEILPFLKA